MTANQDDLRALGFVFVILAAGIYAHDGSSITGGLAVFAGVIMLGIAATRQR